MDTLSHALWGRGLFGYQGHLWIALFFGAFPDIVSFGLWMPAQFFTSDFDLTKAPALDLLPTWLFVTYNLTHSLVIATLVIMLVTFWRKSIAFAMLAWPFHILLDIPFHTAEFFPTKMFWPLSDAYIDGISWTNPWVWFANIAGLIVLYLWRWRTAGKR